MTHRRRYSNHGNNSTVWNAGTAVNVFAIPTITTIFLLGGFYLITKDTLARHEAAISENIPRQFNEENKKIVAEADQRSKNRDEFLDRLSKINDAVSTLNTHAAVQDQNSKVIADTLERISRQLETNPIRR